MKTAHKALYVGALAFAACASLAGISQANRRIENKVLEDGRCYSPQEGYNDCDLTSRFNVLNKRRICSSSCGVWDGKLVMEIWQIEVP